jgi:predicted MFS family arabinose efflux permease
MLGLLNGVYGGIGQSAGAVLGGYLSKRQGIGRAFVLAAQGQAVVLLLFGLYLFLINTC